MFLHNAWYVAAWDREVTREPLGRIFLNEPVVLYRLEDGSPVALEDRCCHRRFPLHKGTLTGDLLQCHYHGLQFDRTGACVRVPGQDTVPPQARVRRYPLVERNKWLWIWMGDPALADESGIEDFHWIDDPDWGCQGTRFHVEADYRLIIENLLDLSHLTYVHASTIGNDATANAAEVTTEREGDLVRVTRWMIDQPAPPTYVKAAGFTTNVDRWQIIEYTPAAFIRLYTGAAETGTGAPQGNRVGGIGLRNLNAMTPETGTTTHYFWAQAHDYRPDDADHTAWMFRQIETAFLQDVDVFHAQQRNIGLDPEAPFISLASDAGGLQALRVLDRRIRDDAQARPAAAE